MKKSTSKKLFNYGAMSAALLGTASVSGQIMYTDLEPDGIINAGEAINIDLNGDGINDYSPGVVDVENGFGANLFTTPDVDPFISVFPGSTGNGFVGQQIEAPDTANVDFYYYVSNLTRDTPIGPDSTIQRDVRGFLNFYSCAYPNSQFCNNVTDGFIGLALNLEGATHYGWMRVDVTRDAGFFVIKDFAFEATPDTEILAGEGQVLSLSDNTIEGLTSFVANNTLTISAVNPLQKVTINSLNGQEVISRELRSTTETIDVNALSTGVYIASIQSEGITTAIKFVR